MSNDKGETTLGELVTIQRGKTYRSKLLGFPGPVLLGLASIARNGGFRRDSLQTYGGSTSGNLRVIAGDLFVSLKDVTQAADLLGAVARVPNDIEGRLTQDTVRLDFYNPDKWRTFVYWVLRTPQYRDFCRRYASGTTNLGLARGDFLNYPIPAKNARRKAIVELLEHLEDRIANNLALAQNLESIARAIFKSWFVDFDPVRFKAAGRQPVGLNEDIASLFPDQFVDSALGKVPQGWFVTAIAEIADLNSRSWTKKTYPEQIEYVDISNTCAGRIEATEWHSWSSAPSRARRILEPGDTIVATVRPGNRAFAQISRENLTGSTGFAVLTPHNPEHSPFVYLSVTDDRSIDRLASLADGGAYPAVRPNVVAETPIVLPEAAVLEEFCAVVRPLLDRANLSQRQNEVLSKLRDALLPRLISGELRVARAEQAIANAI